MAILEPVKVVITNLTSAQTQELQVPNIPHLPDKGTHAVPFDPCDLYIERGDLREVSMPDAASRNVTPLILYLIFRVTQRRATGGWHQDSLWV